MTLENIPEGYTPFSNIIKDNDIEFSFKDLRFSYDYCGVSTYKNNSDIFVLCVKNEHIGKLKDYYAKFGMSDFENQMEDIAKIDSIPDLLRSFKVEYGFHPNTMKGDPILTKQIVDSYPSDRIKQMLKNRLFGTPIEGEWPTVDSIVLTYTQNVSEITNDIPF